MATDVAAMELEEFLQPLVVDDSKLVVLATELSKTYRSLAVSSTEQFLATPVTSLPHGGEKGTFLAIDVGGTNLRVGFVELLGHDRFGNQPIRRSHEKAWPIEEQLKTDVGENLFNWIGNCIAEVITEYVTNLVSPKLKEDVLANVIPMGITFSFPMTQTSITDATLMRMGKGFMITSNLNLGKLLVAGYERRTQQAGMSNATPKHDWQRPVSRQSDRDRLPRVQIVAISNDAVATLAALDYFVKSQPNSKVVLGLIVGTGTNAACIMKVEHLHSFKRQSMSVPRSVGSGNASVVVNTEWSINGAALPLTQLGLVTIWDAELDRCCEAPGFQPFEYMTSGRYLGELFRIIVRSYLTTALSTDPSKLPEALSRRNAIDTVFLSGSVANATSANTLLPVLGRRLPPPEESEWRWTLRTAHVVISVARAIQLRSAALVAAAVVGLLDCIGELSFKSRTIDKPKVDEVQNLIVACAGGVIDHYSGFQQSCQQTIDRLVCNLTHPESPKRVTLQGTPHAGIIGAGVLAGTVWNLQNSHAPSS